MLAYLDALLDALSLRDSVEVHRLLAHPLERILTEAVRDEVRAIVSGQEDALAAPLRLMQLRHMTAQLLHESAEVAVVADHPASAAPPASEQGMAPPANPARDATRPQPVRHRRAGGRLVQMELPLSA